MISCAKARRSAHASSLSRARLRRFSVVDQTISSRELEAARGAREAWDELELRRIRAAKRNCPDGRSKYSLESGPAPQGCLTSSPAAPGSRPPLQNIDHLVRATECLPQVPLLFELEVAGRLARYSGDLVALLPT